MADAESLKRLGGGRWETKDGRFSIEPQSGTWAVVDNSQTDELGLPLVRGPYPSLTAAKEAIETERAGGPAESPLAQRIAKAGKAEPKDAKAKARAREPEQPKVPEEPPEPKWLRDLAPDRKREVQRLISRLEKAGVDEAEAVARGELVLEQPALARLALERRLAAAAEEDDAAGAIRQAIEALLDGTDTGLGARWQLVDGNGRQIRRLELGD